uniref:Protein kinase domain-containing protein n=1 Tax=Spongospora subterranea TaxID=70186 RepID=A0A0H5R6L8_9EUKA|eukprot:CRZ09763.1 hypothetical protein [Spongospora subterranea]
MRVTVINARTMFENARIKCTIVHLVEEARPPPPSHLDTIISHSSAGACPACAPPSTRCPPNSIRPRPTFPRPYPVTDASRPSWPVPSRAHLWQWAQVPVHIPCRSAIGNCPPPLMVMDKAANLSAMRFHPWAESPPPVLSLMGSGSKRVALSSPIIVPTSLAHANRCAQRLNFQDDDQQPSWSRPNSIPLPHLDDIEFITPVDQNTPKESDDHIRARPRLSLEHQRIRRSSNLLSPETPCSQTKIIAKSMTPDLTMFDEDKVQKKTPRLARQRSVHTVTPVPRHRAALWSSTALNSLYEEMQLDATSNYGHDLHKHLFMKDFYDLRIVGDGHFYQVCRAISRVDHRPYALKRSKKPFRGLKDRESYLREVHALRRIPLNEHVIEYHRAWQEQGHLFIQMELCKSSLSDFLFDMSDDGSSVLNTGFIINCMWQIAQGLSHIHSHGVVHLDIKPDNILIASYGLLKIADFGQCIRFPLEKDSDLDVHEGDSRYVAPELFRGGYSLREETMAAAADLFSLGILALELHAQLELPSTGPAWHSLRDGTSASRYLEFCDPALSSLIMSMLSPDPALRPKADQVVAATSSMARSWPCPDLAHLIDQYQPEPVMGA